MYPAAVNSQSTVTMGALDISTTQVTVLDASVLPDAPNLLVLGTDQTAETVLMTAKDGNVLTIERAFQGTAKIWPAGTGIARNMTAYDMDTLKENMEDVSSAISTHIADNENPHEVTAAQVGAATPADLAGYLPLSGGELSGSITIKKESSSFVDLYNLSKSRRARLQINNTDVVLAGFLNFLDDSNYVRIDLKPETQSKDTLLTLGVVKSGKSTTYKILGEHYLCLDGIGPHNATYRGKALGSVVTAEQWAAIANGTFTDLYIGDYWTIGGINYRIAAFDYYLRSGDTDMTTHHVTLVPDTNMYTHVMNDTNTTEGAYVGSKMYTEGLAQAKTTINNAFGAAHILKHRRYMQNAVTNGYSTGGAWCDSTVELMTEQNVYGGVIFGSCENGTAWPNLYTNDKSQYPLFAMRPDMISARNTYWLRDVASASRFCLVDGSGYASAYHASSSLGVRPAFSIKS